jgi:cobalt/nickel transport system permease protein
MARIVESIYNVHYLEELSYKKTFIHSLNPVIKLLVTIVFIATTISFGKYDISALVPLIFYPIVIFAMAEIPVVKIFKRVLPVLPLVIGVAIFNPIIDNTPLLSLGEITISAGWISFFTLILKSIFTIVATLLLIVTTGIDKIGMALRRLKVPKIFVTQLLLTYRYISVLMEEGANILKAYHLRAPMLKGVSVKDLGSILGNMLLRTFDRAGKIYDAMVLRGFCGEYELQQNNKISIKSILYLILWSIFFILVRRFNVSEIIGHFVLGVMV